MSDLTERERIVFDAMNAAAEACLPAPKHDELNELIGCTSTSSSPTIVRRLEEKGLIQVERFQRTRQVCIVATGKCTAIPMGSHAHHVARGIGKDTPVPSPQTMKAREPDLFRAIAVDAGAHNVPLVEFMQDMMAFGYRKWKEARGTYA